MGLTSEGDTNLDVDSGFTIDLTTNLINHRGETNIVLHMVGGMEMLRQQKTQGGKQNTADNQVKESWRASRADGTYPNYTYIRIAPLD